jgi:uncharacterized phiE125 gp8 family phage protein
MTEKKAPLAGGFFLRYHVLNPMPTYPAVVAYALTTVARVKTRLGISDSNDDTLLLQLVNEATDAIESFCDRRFKSTTYTTEVYSGGDGGHYRLVLRQSPVTTLTAFQFRQGSISNSTYSAVDADSYELEDAGRTGIIGCLFPLSYGMNNYRVTYTAGYLIDFANEGDVTKHTLPADLTSACEQLVAMMYNVRKSAGVQSEALGAHNVTWSDLLGVDNNGRPKSAAMSIIQQYVRPNYLI